MVRQIFKAVLQETDGCLDKRVRIVNGVNNGLVAELTYILLKE